MKGEEGRKRIPADSLEKLLSSPALISRLLTSDVTTFIPIKLSNGKKNMHGLLPDGTAATVMLEVCNEKERQKLLAMKKIKVKCSEKKRGEYLIAIPLSLVDSYCSERGIMLKKDKTKKKEHSKEYNKQRKEKIREGDWEEVVSMITTEDSPDTDFYKDCLLKGGINLEMLKDMAMNRDMRMTKHSNGTIEISFRKGDHTAVTTISEDGKVQTMMMDFLPY